MMPNSRRNGFRAIALLTLLATLGGCLPPNVYSRIPTDPAGMPVDATTLDAVELAHDERYELNAGESIQIEPGEIILLSTPDEFGSRRVKRYPMEDVLQVRQKREDGSGQWLQVASILDFSQLDPLPRVDTIILQDGTVLSLRDAPEVGWSADRLSLEYRDTGGQTFTVLLDDIDRVMLVQGNPVLSTLGSVKFWAVAGAAAALTIWLNNTEDDDSLATR